eukprot:255433_1
MAQQPLDEDTPDIVLKSIFKYFDKDGSGFLDKKEFGAYLNSLGLGDQAFKAEALRALSDDDNDGKIDFNEFRNFIKTDNAKKIVNDLDEFQFLCTVCDVFKKYDTDGDGAVSWEEWKAEMIKTGKTEKEAKELFEVNDKNNDQKITFDEFYHSLVD